MARRSKCKIRHLAIALQLIIYIANAAAWVLTVSILASICGFVIGMGNDTIRVDLHWLDLAITTPATAIILYGLFLTLVTTVGCFSSLSATIILSWVYIVFIILYFVFDIFLGLSSLYKEDSLLDFHREVNSSLNGYDDGGAKGIGIFALSPTDYWDHLQSRGKCCGFESFEDWKRTKYSKTTFSIPDSCCNEKYSHRYCGAKIFLRHPDLEHHSVGDMLHSKGCLRIFPVPMQIPVDSRIAHIVRFVACMLILCAVLTLVIIFLVGTKKFRSEQGLDNIDYVETRKGSLASLEHGDQGTSKNRTRSQTRSIASGPTMGNRTQLIKVHPESGDRKRSSADKQVLFKESGPQFIPTEHNEREKPKETTEPYDDGKSGRQEWIEKVKARHSNAEQEHRKYEQNPETHHHDTKFTDVRPSTEPRKSSTGRKHERSDQVKVRHASAGHERRKHDRNP